MRTTPCCLSYISSLPLPHLATLHYTTLHYTTLHYTTLHYTTLASSAISNIAHTPYGCLFVAYGGGMANPFSMAHYGCCTLTPPYTTLNESTIRLHRAASHSYQLYHPPHYTPSKTRDRWPHFAQDRYRHIPYYGHSLWLTMLLHIELTITIISLRCTSPHLTSPHRPTGNTSRMSSPLCLSPHTSTTSVTLLAAKLQSFKVSVSSVSSVSSEIPPTVSVTLSVSNARS
jgi:hypothetical protein